MGYKTETENRVQNRRTRSLLDVNTMLEHFAIISYRVPIDRIVHLIPKPFKLWTYIENGTEYALVSAVPFKDRDFSFYRISKSPKLNFFQTNLRTYIIDERDQSNAAWFFGTTLGSIASIIPEKIWGMPWKYAKYSFDFKKNKDQYSEYNMSFKSKQGDGLVKISSTKKGMELLTGFKNMDEQIHILTHPIIGYYNNSNKGIGTYEIWHRKIDLHKGVAKEVYFELFEKLGLLSKSEMMQPHSVLIAPKIEFDILLPPKRWNHES